MNTFSPKPTVTKINCRPYIRNSIYSGESFHTKTMTLGRYKTTEISGNLVSKSLEGNEIKNMIALNGFSLSRPQTNDCPIHELKYGVDVNDISLCSYGNQKTRSPERTIHTNCTLMDTIDSKNDPELARELDQVAISLGLKPKRTSSENNMRTNGERCHSSNMSIEKIIPTESLVVCAPNSSTPHVSPASPPLRLTSRSVTKNNDTRNNMQLGRVHSGRRVIQRFLHHLSSSLHRSFSRRPSNRNRSKPPPENGQTRSTSLTSVHSGDTSHTHRDNNYSNGQTNYFRKFPSTPLPAIHLNDTDAESFRTQCHRDFHTIPIFHNNSVQNGTLTQNQNSRCSCPTSKLFIANFPEPERSKTMDPTILTNSTQTAPVYLSASVSAFGYGLKPGWKQFCQLTTEGHPRPINTIMAGLDGQRMPQALPVKTRESSHGSSKQHSENSFEPYFQKSNKCLNNLKGALDEYKNDSHNTFPKSTGQSLNILSDSLAKLNHANRDRNCTALAKRGAVEVEQNGKGSNVSIPQYEEGVCHERRHSEHSTPKFDDNTCSKYKLVRRHTVHIERDKHCPGTDHSMFKLPMTPFRSITPPHIYRSSASAALKRTERKRELRNAHLHNTSDVGYSDTLPYIASDSDRTGFPSEVHRPRISHRKEPMFPVLLEDDLMFPGSIKSPQHIETQIKRQTSVSNLNVQDEQTECDSFTVSG